MHWKREMTFQWGGGPHPQLSQLLRPQGLARPAATGQGSLLWPAGKIRRERRHYTTALSLQTSLLPPCKPPPSCDFKAACLLFTGEACEAPLARRDQMQKLTGQGA